MSSRLPSQRDHRVAEAIRGRAAHGSVAAWLDAVLAAIGAGAVTAPELAAWAAEVAALADADAGFAWQVGELRLRLRAPGDDDSIRERYGELVDAHRDHPARLAAIRELGAEIRRLEDEGALPRAMVIRSRRRDTTQGG